MGKIKRLIKEGDQFERLTATSDEYPKKIKGKSARVVDCVCSCGKKRKAIRKSSLVMGYTKSCGCFLSEVAREKMMGNTYGTALAANLKGNFFGRLRVIERYYPAGDSKHKTYLWRCQCKCGNEHITLGNSLLRGKTKSCGCLVRDINSGRHALARMEKNKKIMEEMKGKQKSRLPLKPDATLDFTVGDLEY